MTNTTTTTTTTTTTKPAVLFVHGAYFLPESFTDFIHALESAGFVVSCPRLPTCGDSRPPTKGFQDDVSVTRKAAQDLQAAGHPVIVLAHSFGGVVATEAITESLYAPKGENAASGPGVVRIVYTCAHLPTPGNSLGTIFAKHGFLCDVDLAVNDDGTAYAKNQEHAWYNDLPTHEAHERAKTVITHNFALIGDKQVENSPWQQVPSTYIFCSQDVAIKLPLQEAMVKDAEEMGGRFDKRTVDAGHLPFFSRPDEIVSIVRDVWQQSQSQSK